MANTTENNTFSLPQASVKYLRDLINTPSWADEIWKLRHGGAVYDILPEPETPDLSAATTQEQVTALNRAWAEKTLPEFTLTDKQVKAVKACLKHYVPKAALPANKFSLAILDAFEVEEDEK